MRIQRGHRACFGNGIYNTEFYYRVMELYMMGDLQEMYNLRISFYCDMQRTIRWWGESV